MITERYYSVSEEVVKMMGIGNDRYKVEGDRYIVTGSDFKHAVMAGLITPIDFPKIDVREVSDGEAKALIARNGYEIGGEGGLPHLEETEEETAAEETQEESEDNEEPSEEEPVDEESVEETPATEENDNTKEEEE